MEPKSALFDPLAIHSIKNLIIDDLQNISIGGQQKMLILNGDNRHRYILNFRLITIHETVAPPLPPTVSVFGSSHSYFMLPSQGDTPASIRSSPPA